MTEFLHRIGDGPDPSDLRDLLSTALGDRSLQVVYWLDRPRTLGRRRRPSRRAARRRRPGPRRHRGSSARAARSARSSTTARCARTRSSSARSPPRPASRSRTSACRRSCARGVEELRASRARIVAAGTAERRRLERNLHDGAQQRLVALSLTLRVAQSQLRKDPDGAEATDRRRPGGADAARSRSCASWRAGSIPPSSPTAASSRRSRRSPAARRSRSRSSETPDERLPPAVEAAAYFVVAEALTNVVKYAGRLAGADLDLAHQRPRRRGGRRRRRRRGRSDPWIGAARPRRPGLRPRRNARVAVTAGRGDRASCFDPRMSDPIRVVIADDSVLLREGLARLLEEFGFEVAAQAGDAEDLLRKVGSHKPDVAVVDVRMPPTHTDEGLRAAHEIRATHPETGVLVLSQYVEEAYALELLSESTRVDRLPAQGPRRRRRLVHRRRPARRERRLGARSRGRRAAARPAPARGPAAVDHAARARGARADGRGPLERGDRRGAGRDRARGREARHLDLLQARPDARRRRTTAASSPCCAYLRAA